MTLEPESLFFLQPKALQPKAAVHKRYLFYELVVAPAAFPHKLSLSFKLRGEAQRLEFMSSQLNLS